MLPDQDPALLQDFLTESNELIDRLDADLVRLEHEANARELLDGIFRALHTIKGAASFLSLTSVTRFSHAAEDALNRLRKGEAEVDAEVIDVLLKSVDVLRGMMSDVAEGVESPPGPQDLVARLERIAGSEHAPQSKAPQVQRSTAAITDEGCRPLNLSSEKADLLGGLVAELEAAIESIETGAIAETAQGLEPTARYFEFPALIGQVHRLHSAIDGGPESEAVCEETVRFIKRFIAALREGNEITSVGDPSPGPAKAPPSTLEPTHPASSAASPTSQEQPKESAGKGESSESTVRVEVARLEALLNLVGELVLTKNQVLGAARQLRNHALPHDVLENVTGVAGALDRLTSELQVGVMRTRLQPLNKLFGRYPRVVRDLARATGKEIDVEIIGGETEVDKGVLEQLADPMVHILRNSADHGIEQPDVRLSAGKPRAGRIRIDASHQGGHVRVAIEDDGKGIDPEVIGRKAVEKGLITEASRAAMSPQEIINLVFAPGFSTAEKVSDLSGRGVGMDVVRTNIQKLGGNVSVTSSVGKGSVIEVLIPLTVAIMPAMHVKVGKHQYALPLACITEIVRLDDVARHTVTGQSVIRIRENVLPLIALSDRLGEPKGLGEARFAVVVMVGAQKSALSVDELVGQQDVVIKPLEDKYTKGGPFSGATIREDGDVSLIIDPAALIRTALTPESASHNDQGQRNHG